jgi:hypothetical protein
MLLHRFTSLFVEQPLTWKEAARPLKIKSLRLIRHFEFWNTHIFHLPIYLYWLYLSCKARSLFFFSAANPGIETGGMMGESKYAILKKIAPQLLPQTLFYPSVPLKDKVMDDLAAAKMAFPIIAKPDIGQGGWLIEMVRDQHELQQFLLKIKMPFMVQEYVTDPLEFGLLYYRLPGSAKGKISSLASKEFLSVTGNGHSTILGLLQLHPRVTARIKNTMAENKIDVARVPGRNEKVILSYKGNHSCGTMFQNANQLVDDQLTQVFDNLCASIPGFYFGRFDLRCKSIADLKAGKFKILELNGAGSEPLHIFDPSEKLWNAYASAFEHWKAIYAISKLNRSAGMKCMRLAEAWRIYKEVRRIQQVHNRNFAIGN